MMIGARDVKAENGDNVFVISGASGPIPGWQLLCVSFVVASSILAPGSDSVEYTDDGVL